MMESKVLWMLWILPALGVLALGVLRSIAVIKDRGLDTGLKTARRWSGISIFLGLALFVVLWLLGSEAVQQDALLGLRFLFWVACAQAGLSLLLWCVSAAKAKNVMSDCRRELILASAGGLFLVVLSIVLQVLFNSL